MHEERLTQINCLLYINRNKYLIIKDKVIKWKTESDTKIYNKKINFKMLKVYAFEIHIF